MTGWRLPSDRASLYARITRPVQDQRVNKTRWVVLRWPTPSMAQSAGMSTEAFENLYFDVCTMDYRKMARAMVPLWKRMKKLGVEFTMEPTNVGPSIVAVLDDTCGNLIQIYEVKGEG